MRKIYLLAALAAMTTGVMAQQMTITTTGAAVTFKAPLGGDWESAPMYIYVYLDGDQTTPHYGGGELAPWPGTQMMGPDGDGNYSTTFDLSTYDQFQGLDSVDDLRFIYNDGGHDDGNGGTGYWQNPGGGQPGFLASDPSRASGWTPVLLGNMAVADISLAKKSAVIGGQYHTAQKGKLQLQVVDYSGKVVKQLDAVSDGSNPINLNFNQKGSFILVVKDGKQAQAVKFVQ